MTLFEVRDFIDRHYAKPLTVERLAAKAGVSTFHFIRAFGAAFGQTPHQYLRARRITGETPAGFRAQRRKSVYIPTCFVRMYRADK